MTYERRQLFDSRLDRKPFEMIFCFFFCFQFRIQKCEREAVAINVDENLLQLEITAFPTLNEMLEKIEPIEKLWKTAHNFDSCFEIW